MAHRMDSENKRIKRTVASIGERLLENFYQEVSAEMKKLASRKVNFQLPARKEMRTSIGLDRCLIPDVRIGWFVLLRELGQDSGILAWGRVRKIVARDRRQDLVIIRFLSPLNLRNIIEQQPEDQKTVELTIELQNPHLLKSCRRIYHAVDSFKRLKYSQIIAKLLLGDIYENSQVWRPPKELSTPFSIDFQLDKQQNNAFRFAIAHKLTLIEGCVASGKTQLAACIAHCLAYERRLKVLICSANSSNVNQIVKILQGTTNKHKQDPTMTTKSNQNDRGHRENRVRVVRVTNDKRPKEPPIRHQINSSYAQKELPKLRDLVGFQLYKRFYEKHQKYSDFYEKTKQRYDQATRLNINTCCRETRKGTEFKILENADIVCCTSWQAGRQLLDKRLKFQVLIIDDAHLHTDAGILIPLMTPNIKQLVLLGQDLIKLNINMSEHKKWGDKNLNIGLEEYQLFSRLVNSFGPHIRLKRQYRSHEELFKFCNENYHNNELRTTKNPRTRFVHLCVTLGDFSWLPSSKALNSMSCIFVSNNQQQQTGLLLNETIKGVVDKIVEQEKFPYSAVSIITNLDQLHKFDNDKELQYKGIRIMSASDVVGLENDFIILLCIEPTVKCHRSSHELDPDFTRDELTLHIVLTRAKMGLFIVVTDESMIDFGSTSNSEYKLSSSNSQSTPWIDLEPANYCKKWRDLVECHRKMDTIVRFGDDNKIVSPSTTLTSIPTPTTKLQSQSQTQTSDPIPTASSNLFESIDKEIQDNS